LPNDVPIAIQAARHLKAVVDGKVLAVVRPGADELSRRLRAEGCEVVVCENAAEGMGASLACAVRCAGAADAYLVALGDMPFIRSSTIAAVRDALVAGAPLVAPYFRARRGHPVGLASKFRNALAALEGDEGAREIISMNEKDLVKIPVGDPGVLRDIDTPGDLAPPIVV
jgi:molybdenum cofactor cytidylyltransferase